MSVQNVMPENRNTHAPALEIAIREANHPDDSELLNRKNTAVVV